MTALVGTEPRRLVGRQGMVLTLADQMVSSAASFLLGVVVARAGGADALGAFGVAFLIWLAVLGVNRALVNEPMTVLGADEYDRAEVRDGLLGSVSIGVAAALAVAAGCGAAALGGLDPGVVLGLAPWLPSLLAQDYVRALAFRRQRADQALAIDLVFGGVQAALTVLLFLTDRHTTGWFLGAWGVGATAGALVGMLLHRFGGFGGARGALRRLRALWPKSRWFLAEFLTSFPADQGYLLLLPLLIGTADFGMYRAGASLIGPVVVVFVAGGNIGLPESVRRLRQDGLPGLSSYATKLTMGIVAMTVLYCGAAAALAVPLLTLSYGAEFAGAALVTYFVAGQYAIYALCFGWGIAMKTAGAMRLLWTVRLVSVVVSVTSVITFTSLWGLSGAALAGVVAATAYSTGVLTGSRRLAKHLDRPQ